jgi:hypothetical protein
MKTRFYLAAALVSNSILFSQNVTLDWVKLFGGTGDDYSAQLKQLSDGSLINGGGFLSTVDFDPSANVTSISPNGYENGYLSKFDSNGNLQFVKQIGSGGYTDISRMETDASDNIYLAGFLSGTADFDPSPGTYTLSASGSTNRYFAKYNSTGDLIFAKTIGATGLFSINDLKVDNQGNIILAGLFGGTCDFDPSAASYTLTNSANASIPFVAKYDNNGALVFAFPLVDPGTGYSSAKGLSIDNTNNIYVAGLHTATTDFDPGSSVVNVPVNADQELFFAKYDASGNFVYAKGLVSDNAGFSDYNAMILDNLGNIYLAAYANSKQYIDLDPSSASYTMNFPALQMAFIAKYDNNGSFVDARLFQGYPSPTVSTVYPVNMYFVANNLYVLGLFGGIDFDFSAGVHGAVAHGSWDIFTAAYDSGFNNILSVYFGGPQDENAAGAVISSGELYIAGIYSDSCEFDPAGNGIFHHSNGSYDCFLAKYDYPPLSVESVEQTLTAAYPNPFSETLFFKHMPPGSCIKLFNELGQESLSVKTSSNAVNTSSLPPGCYIVEITSEGQTSRSKMIKY